MTEWLAFNHARLAEQIREVAPMARYVAMGADAFASYHNATGPETRALRDLPVIAIYSRDLAPNTVLVYDIHWNVIRELVVATE